MVATQDADVKPAPWIAQVARLPCRPILGSLAHSLRLPSMATRGNVTAESESEPFYDSAARLNPARNALTDLYRYRALVRLLVARELTVRYKRSLLGVAWTVLNPLLTTMVMWVVFNHLFRFKIPGGVPYVVYLLSGILAVTYFQQGIAMTAASMTSSAGMLTKVYVPPVVFALSAACAGAVNLLFGLVPLLALEAALGPGIAWTVIAVPIPLFFLLCMIAGIGLFLSTLAVQFNDVLDLTNVITLLIAYLTPTFYPITTIPVSYRRFFLLNPMYSYVDVFRHLEYGGTLPPWQTSLIVVLTGVVGLATGLVVFVRRWPTLAVLL